MLKRFVLTLIFASTVVFAAPPVSQKPAETKPASDGAKAPDAPTEKVANPKVLIRTNMGEISVELYPDKAPKTVENFLQYLKDGFYDGTVFHRVIDGFMIQGGGFTKDLTQKRTRAPIHNEANNGLSNQRGTLAMARTGDPHSATAQFFINIVDNNRLDYVSEQNGMTWGYCVFGKVISGMEVVDKIKAVPTAAQGPLPRDVPTTAIVIEKMSITQ